MNTFPVLLGALCVVRMPRSAVDDPERVVDKPTLCDCSLLPLSATIT